MPTDPAWRAGFCAAGERYLSSGETDRRAGMKRPGPAARFLAGRVLLRTVLARYLSQDPAAIGLALNAVGKPELADRTGRKIAFSLSHTRGETVLAVAGEGEIGIDIESVDRSLAVDRISRHFFSERERRYLDRCGADRAEKSLTLWTLKEAIVKARGQSVWDGLAGISLTIDGPHLVWEPPPPGRGTWRLAAGSMGEGTVLAVALAVPDGDDRAPLVFRYRNVSETPAGDARFTPDFTTCPPVVTPRR